MFGKEGPGGGVMEGWGEMGAGSGGREGERLGIRVRREGGKTDKAWKHKC